MRSSALKLHWAKSPRHHFCAAWLLESKFNREPKLNKLRQRACSVFECQLQLCNFGKARIISYYVNGNRSVLETLETLFPFTSRTPRCLALFQERFSREIVKFWEHAVFAVSRKRVRIKKIFPSSHDWAARQLSRKIWFMISFRRWKQTAHKASGWVHRKILWTFPSIFKN